MQIIEGDFNVTFNHEIDNFDYVAPRNVNSRRALNNLLINFFFNLLHIYYHVRRNKIGLQDKN